MAVGVELCVVKEEAKNLPASHPPVYSTATVPVGVECTLLFPQGPTVRYTVDRGIPRGSPLLLLLLVWYIVGLHPKLLLEKGFVLSNVDGNSNTRNAAPPEQAHG